MAQRQNRHAQGSPAGRCPLQANEPYGGGHGASPPHSPPQQRPLHSYNAQPYQYNSQHARLQQAPSPPAEPAARRARHGPAPPQQQQPPPQHQQPGSRERKEREAKGERGRVREPKQPEQQPRQQQVPEADQRYQQLSEDIAQLVSEVGHPPAPSPPAPLTCPAAQLCPSSNTTTCRGWAASALTEPAQPLGGLGGEGGGGLALSSGPPSAQVAPDARELQQREQVLQHVSAAAKAALFYAYPRVQAHQLGSGACGMSTHASDLDVVVTGAIQPSLHTGGQQGGPRARLGPRSLAAQPPGRATQRAAAARPSCSPQGVLSERGAIGGGRCLSARLAPPLLRHASRAGYYQSPSEKRPVVDALEVRRRRSGAACAAWGLLGWTACGCWPAGWCCGCRRTGRERLQLHLMLAAAPRWAPPWLHRPVSRPAPPLALEQPPMRPPSPPS
jgi:hypothetical protein